MMVRNSYLAIIDSELTELFETQTGFYYRGSFGLVKIDEAKAREAIAKTIKEKVESKDKQP